MAANSDDGSPGQADREAIEKGVERRTAAQVTSHSRRRRLLHEPVSKPAASSQEPIGRAVKNLTDRRLYFSFRY
jgi:hypothetical protein